MSIGYQALGIGDIHGGFSAGYDRLQEQAAREIESCRRRYAYAVEEFEAKQVANGHCGWCAEFSAGSLHNWGYPVYAPNETGFPSDDYEGKAAESARAFTQLLKVKEQEARVAAKKAHAQKVEAEQWAAAKPFAALLALKARV